MMEVQQVDISSITPYEGNPRRNRNSVGKVADSLKAYGWRQPIVVDEDMVIIAGHTRPDPFLGSGTTIIAAQTEGRHCYGLEIEPVYCDIIVKRWEQFTDQEAVRDQRV